MENLWNTSLDEAKIQQFIARWKELWKSRDEIKSSYDKALSDWFFNKSWVNIQQPQPEKQSFLWWVVEKTWESFQKWISRIWEAGVWLAEWKYNIPEAFGRGWAWALQAATSPIAWVLWETIETWVENIPQWFKDYVSKKAKPTIQDAKDFRASQTPFQKRQLENAWVWLEVLANFIWLNYAKKWLQAWKEAVKETVWESVEQWVKNIKEWISNIKINIPSKMKQTIPQADNISPWLDSTEWSLFSKVKEKLQSKITPERPVEDIAANILQPYKWIAENLDDASRWLQRVINESDTPVDTWDFKELLDKTLPVQQKYGKMLDNELKTIQWLKQSDSADNALTQLKQIYQWVLSKKDKSTLDRVKQLQEKNLNWWLTASEINEIKILHTKANNLFNEKWQTTWWFSSDDLRNIRSELKEEVEKMWEAEWITNIREINKAYWELSDTRMLLENQIKNVQAFKWRNLPETLSQKLWILIGKIPLIKWWLQGLFREAGISLKAWKIDPLEVQKRLPQLIKELRKAWAKEWQIKQIELELSKEFLFPKPPKSLPVWRWVQEVKTIIWPQKTPIKTPYGKVGKTPVQPQWTPTAPVVAVKKPQLTLPPGKVVTPQTAEKWVIIESKKWLPKNDNWIIQPEKISKSKNDEVKPKQVKPKEESNLDIKKQYTIKQPKKVGENKIDKKEVNVVDNKNIELLPKDIWLEEEAKKVWAKRISPDRIEHQQLTPDQWIKKLKDKIEKLKIWSEKALQYLNKYWYWDISWSDKKLSDYLKYKEKLEKWELTWYRESSVRRYVESNKDFFDRLNAKLELKKFLWKEYTNFKDSVSKLNNMTDAEIKDLYIDLVKKDISKWYKFPDEVLKFDKSFKTAVDNRERYEKWLRTSFSADDERIIFDERSKIWMKRQDGKPITKEQIDEVVSWLKEFYDTTWLDIENLLKDEKIVISHLNWKNPFLMKNVAWLYREWQWNKSISLWWTEKIKFKDPDTWEIKTETVNTIMSHELWHTLDAMSWRKMFDDIAIDYKYSYNTDNIKTKSKKDYYSSKNEIKARMIEQYVAVKKWQEKIYDRTWYWKKDIFEKMMPKIEKWLKEYFPDYTKKTK